MFIELPSNHSSRRHQTVFLTESCLGDLTFRWAEAAHPTRLLRLGQTNERLTSHPVFLALGREDSDRQTRYRELFRSSLDEIAIDDIRLALNQNQPLGDNRFTARIEEVTGERREARPRGRPRKRADDSAGGDGRQSTFTL